MNNSNTLAIESFITFCDDMMIAEEGFKDIGKNILKAINAVWQWFLGILKKAKKKITSLFKKDKGEEGSKKDPKEVKNQIDTNEKKIKELEDEIKRLKSGKEESDRNAAQYRAQSEGKDTRIANLQSLNINSTDRIKELESEVNRLTEDTKGMANALKRASDVSADYRQFDILINKTQSILREYAKSLRYEGKHIVKATNFCIKVIGNISRGDDSLIPKAKEMLIWDDEDVSYYRDQYNESIKNLNEVSSTHHRLASALYADAMSYTNVHKSYLEKAKRNIETMEKMITPMKNDIDKHQKALSLLQISSKVFTEITQEASKFASMTFR